MTARRHSVFSLMVLFLLVVAPARPAELGSGDRLIPSGRLLTSNSAHLVVRHEPCRCDLDATEPDVLLLTVGTELEEDDGSVRFHPLAALAFDRTLQDGETGQWLALWVFGPSPAGWRRTLRSVLPLPVGGPSVSAKKLAKLEERLQKLEEDERDLNPRAPDPVLDLTQVGHFPRARGLLGWIRRGLGWADVFNPAQFIYRAHLERRKDRDERRFQRAYLALHWLLDTEFDGTVEADWVQTINDVRFHLLRTRSFFGRFLAPADSVEMVYNYDSQIRHNLGKSSSWLQSAANEHNLRYEPIYRYTSNGSRFPLGGVLYYDPRLPAGDPRWWGVANPFDLPYNPHTHPAVQQLAREHPEEWIPLAVYTFQTHLGLRPAIAIDFFAPGNPRTRERTQMSMVLLRNWLAITTGSLSLERLPYRAVAWAANKKGFTLLVDKSSRLGVEELRVSLEAGLYFDPELQTTLLRQADQRVLNPLIKAGAEEALLARIQYESLQALGNRALCRAVGRIRRKMQDKTDIPKDLPAEEQRRLLARRLVDWGHLMHLQISAASLGDYGTLESLREPLQHFRDAGPPYPSKLEPLLADLYSRLYREQLSQEGTPIHSEMEDLRRLTRQVWEAVAAKQKKAFAFRLEETEEKAQAEHEKEKRRMVKKELQALGDFLKDTRDELKRAARGGCDPTKSSPIELEAYLTLLHEISRAASRVEPYRSKFHQHRPELEQQLSRVESTLAACPETPSQQWRADLLNSNLALARRVQQELARTNVAALSERQ